MRSLCGRGLLNVRNLLIAMEFSQKWLQIALTPIEDIAQFRS